MDTRSWLVATATLTACLWLPHVLDRFLKLGILRTFGNPKSTDLAELAPWAQRAHAAHLNAMVNLAVFAPLVLAAMNASAPHASSVNTAAGTYFVARLVHFVAYTAGVPFVRTLAFLIGWGAQLVLAYVTLTHGAL